MKVITLTNEKGGVGKTTMALHIAAGLALMNKRVLLIDSDPQGHVAHQLKMKDYGALYRLLIQDEEWKTVLREPEFARWGGKLATSGRLLVLQSNIETRGIPMMTGNTRLLRERLVELDGVLDYVVIDTPPTASMLQAMVFAATDYVLFPTLCESLSLDGLAKSTFHVQEQNEARPEHGLSGEAVLMGVIPTMVNMQTAAHCHGIDLLEEHFTKKYGNSNLIWTPFAQRTIWREAGFAQKTLFAYEAHHEVTTEVALMVEKVASHAA